MVDIIKIREFVFENKEYMLESIYHIVKESYYNGVKDKVSKIIVFDDNYSILENVDRNMTLHEVLEGKAIEFLVFDDYSDKAIIIDLDDFKDYIENHEAVIKQLTDKYDNLILKEFVQGNEEEMKYRNSDEYVLKSLIKEYPEITIQILDEKFNPSWDAYFRDYYEDIIFKRIDSL